jgi:hypothetical protein
MALSFADSRAESPHLVRQLKAGLGMSSSWPLIMKALPPRNLSVEANPHGKNGPLKEAPLSRTVALIYLFQ